MSSRRLSSDPSDHHLLSELARLQSQLYRSAVLIRELTEACDRLNDRVDRLEETRQDIERLR